MCIFFGGGRELVISYKLGGCKLFFPTMGREIFEGA